MRCRKEWKNTMTKEQWVIIDNALKEYEEYGRKVQEYLVFLMGGHSESEVDRVMEGVPKQIEILEEERHSTSKKLLEQFIGGYGEFESIILDSSEEYKRNNIHGVYLTILRNTKSWLNAARMYYNALVPDYIITKGCS